MLIFNIDKIPFNTSLGHRLKWGKHEFRLVLTYIMTVSGSNIIKELPLKRPNHNDGMHAHSDVILSWTSQIMHIWTFFVKH